MRKILISLFMYCASLISFSQSENVGIIRVGETFKNITESKLFYLPESKLNELLKNRVQLEIAEKKIDLYKELVSNRAERIYSCDSAIALKGYEADFWKGKLDENDLKLEAQRKRTLEVEDNLDKAKKSRLYYFFAGIVSTSIAVAAIK